MLAAQSARQRPKFPEEKHGFFRGPRAPDCSDAEQLPNIRRLSIRIASRRPA